MNKLPVEFKAKWLAALRSGEYSQVKDFLRTPRGFCCLGVACHLHDPEQWFPVKERSEDPSYDHYESRSRQYDLPFKRDLPDDVFAVLEQHYGATKSYMAKIADLNDEGRSFEEIADWIEERL